MRSFMGNYRQVSVVTLLALAMNGGFSASRSAGQLPLVAGPPPGEQEFVSLMDLNDDGSPRWTGYGRDLGKGSWPEGWELADGVLHLSESGGVDLRTVKEYGDFDLRFEWKISPGGNSGVMYRVSEEKGPSYETGPEYQVLDNAAHKDGKNKLTSTASLYGLYPPSKDAAKPVGQWNEGRIVLRGNRVEHYLNGEKVVEAELGGADWKKRVADSKFAAWPKFGKNKRGYIVLQDHGDEAWYRNVRIKELDKKAAG